MCRPLLGGVRVQERVQETEDALDRTRDDVLAGVGQDETSGTQWRAGMVAAAEDEEVCLSERWNAVVPSCVTEDLIRGCPQCA